MRSLFDRLASLLKRSTRAATSTAFVVATLALASVALAQPPGPGRPFDRRADVKPIPSARYYEGASLIELGRYSDAIKFYQNEIRNGMKIGTSLWIDSICYYAMIGESYYHAGRLDDALKNYNSALTIATAYPSWTAKVTYTTGVSSAPKPAAPWGVSRRDCPLGAFPSKATILIGENETDIHKRLGVHSEQRSLPIDPVEIFRCISLCLRRRIEILGPLAPYDPMSAQILDVFSKRSVAPNHWSVVFFDVIWALALEESDKTTQAVKTFNDSLMAAGQCDHNLTCVVLYELGEIFRKSSKLREATECYYEAAISAYHYGDLFLIEESLRMYSNCVKALRRSGGNPPLAQAYRWAKLNKYVELSNSLGLELVEDFVYSGKTKLAQSGLAAVDASMRGEMRATRAADRWNYLRALVAYASGNAREGDASLDKAIAGVRARSTWSRQLFRLDDYVKRGLSSNGLLTPRNAADLYEFLLREPTVVDWATQPMESLAIQMIAPIGAYERHFQLLLDRDLKDKAFEVGERIRRERFFSTQTFGGRLISLRYILTVDEALTTPSLRAARESLLFAYPAFEETLDVARDLSEQLDALPTVPSDFETSKRQAELFERLALASAQQEAMLRFIAASRVRIPYVFPQALTVEEVQKRLPEETAILSFVDAEGEMYGFMIGEHSLDAWRIGPSDRVADAVAIFLKTLGNVEGSKQVEASELAKARWKAQGAKLREVVLGASDADAERFNIVFSKLVVVPDSALWYLPFEALCLPKLASQEDESDEDDESADSSDASQASDSDDETDDPESDLDAAYLAEDDEETAVEKEDERDAVDGADETVAAANEEETASETSPVRRKSRTAREKDALDAYENTLVSMAEAADFTIRYSATASLALPNAIGRNAFVDTTIVAGTSFPKEKPETVEAAVERFSQAIPKTSVVVPKSSNNIPGNIYASRLRRLVVWEEVSANDWNWSPIVLGKTRVGNTASDWIASPWGAPRLIVMPGLRTHAEDALRNGGVGLELFLPVLALQASGADAMLLSRWRTGGRSAYDLTQDFVKRYESEPAADAWKHAIADLMKRDVIPEEEPRLKKLGRSESTPKYDSPFWWAGYMLVDSGEAARATDLEEFDQDAVKKADEENALLEDDKEQKDGATPSDDAIPVFVEPIGDAEGDDDAANLPFRASQDEIEDDELAKQDEEGDDFFATDDEDASDNKDGAESENAEENSENNAPESELDDSALKDSALKPDESNDPAVNDDEKPSREPDGASEDKPKEKKTTGRLTLKGKGK